MEIGEYITNSGASVYALSKESGIPYTTLSNLSRGKSNVMECRVVTLMRLSEALGVPLMVIIEGSLTKHNYINDSIVLNISKLPAFLRNSISELEIFDADKDPAFFAAVDTMLLAADRFHKSGAIDNDTYRKLYEKYLSGE